MIHCAMHTSQVKSGTWVKSVEANGISGEVVRKGTNYLSFVQRMARFIRHGLHEVKSPLQKLKDFDKSRVAAGKPPIFTDKKTT